MKYRIAIAAALLAFSIAASSAFAQGVGKAPERPPAAPPVFKDTTPTTDLPSGSVAHEPIPATPPAIPAGTPGDSANATAPTGTTPAGAAPAGTGTTTAEPAKTEPVPPDPCESSQGNYDAYTVCQDMMQKIERMKKGSATRQGEYHPAPPPKAEEKKEEPKKDEAKTDDKKDEAKKDEKADDKAADKSSDAKAADTKTDAKADTAAKPEEKKAATPAPDPNEYGANSAPASLERP